MKEVSKLITGTKTKAGRPFVHFGDQSISKLNTK